MSLDDLKKLLSDAQDALWDASSAYETAARLFAEAAAGAPNVARPRYSEFAPMAVRTEDLSLPELTKQANEASGESAKADHWAQILTNLL